MAQDLSESGSELLKTLYDEHGAALWSFVLGLTGGDRQRAEDVVQETLLRAWRNADSLAENEGSIRGWLLTVARRIVIDEWRTRRSRAEISTDEVPEPAPRDDPDQFVQSWLVADALRRLSDQHRAVLIECFYLGRSVSEAAAKLGIPEGTVKSRTHYALRSLRIVLEEMGVSTR